MEDILQTFLFIFFPARDTGSTNVDDILKVATSLH